MQQLIHLQIFFWELNVLKVEGFLNTYAAYAKHDRTTATTKTYDLQGSGAKRRPFLSSPTKPCRQESLGASLPCTKLAVTG